MSILVYLKNMPYSINAVTFGRMFAEWLNTDLTLLQVRDRKNSDEELQRDFEAAAALVPDRKVSHIIRQGSASENILHEIRSGDYDVVVLRARRAIRYRQRLGKKVARRIAHDSTIPVLIVKDTDKVPALNRILICTGGKDIAIPVIQKGAALAKASGAEVTLLHITTPVPSMYTGMDEIEETFEELLQTDTPTARHLRTAAGLLAEENITAHMEIRQGDVTEEILARSSTEKCDLIIVGAPPIDSRLKEWFMGDVTRNLVNHAECAVLVVR